VAVFTVQVEPFSVIIGPERWECLAASADEDVTGVGAGAGVIEVAEQPTSADANAASAIRVPGATRAIFQVIAERRELTTRELRGLDGDKAVSVLVTSAAWCRCS